MTRTLDALVTEAAELHAYGRSQGFDWDVSTLYIGGGTPGLVPVELLGPFLRQLEETLGFHTTELSEATLEANPENVTDETLAAWSEAGLSRLSIGVQTFDSERLALLGRWCDGPTNRRALERVVDRWQGRWSADLITGLPGSASLPPQRWIDLRADLEELLLYRPGHISLYSLIVEPGTDLAALAATRAVTPPADPIADQLWLTARSTLLTRGYEWYEISNFALPGHRSLHNQSYWRMDWWAGLGPGAEGTLPRREGPALRPLRTRNPKLFPWLSGQQERTALTAPEFAFEHYIAGWRTADGLVPGRFDERFSGGEPAEPRLDETGRLTLNRRLETIKSLENIQFR